MRNNDIRNIDRIVEDTCPTPLTGFITIGCSKPRNSMSAVLSQHLNAVIFHRNHIMLGKVIVAFLGLILGAIAIIACIQINFWVNDLIRGTDALAQFARFASKAGGIAFVVVVVVFMCVQALRAGGSSGL